MVTGNDKGVHKSFHAGGKGGMTKSFIAWEQHFDDLATYVRHNPEILLNHQVLQIPENTRGEFYKLFDQIGQSFLEQHFSAQLSEVCFFIQLFEKLKCEIQNDLNIDSITLPFDLSNFTLHPITFLSGLIRERQFALLKEDIDIVRFTSDCKPIIDDAIDDYFWQAYQYYIALTVFRELEPQEIFLIHAPKVGSHIKTHEFSGVFDKTPYMPALQKTSRVINFDSSSETVFIAPNLIFYSRKLKMYISIRCGLKEARWEQSDIKNETKYHEINMLNKSYGRGWFKLPFIIIYTDSSPNSLALVADRKIIYQPQMILFHQWSSKSEYFDRMREKILICERALRPTDGSFFVHKTSDIFRHGEYDNLSPIKFEYDTLSMNPILSSLDYYCGKKGKLTT